MPEYVTLIGAEQVQRAAAEMGSAADRMLQTAARMEHALQGHAERIEHATQKDGEERRMLICVTDRLTNIEEQVIYRTADMPNQAVAWIKTEDRYKGWVCEYLCCDEQILERYPAPDFFPYTLGPLFLPIIKAHNPFEHERVPEGWKLVPVEPTERMIEELACIGLTQWQTPGMDRCAEAMDAYRAILAAAPQPQEGESDD